MPRHIHLTDEHHYLVVQIRALLDKHLNTNIKENGLWRIQGLVEDELNEKNRDKVVKQC
jgi:hypothetical protein